MLYTATVPGVTPLFPLPADYDSKLVMHDTLDVGSRVAVLMQTADKKWQFVYDLTRAKHAGWVLAQQLRKDPILLLDCYHGDFKGAFPWQKAIDSWRYFGGSLKVTQGLRYDTSWLMRNWKKAHAVAGDRLGDSWFVGGYHYLITALDGAKQADYYCASVEKAGGWDLGHSGSNLLPEVDVEDKGNESASKQQVIDCTEAFAARIMHNLGAGCIGYWRNLPKRLGIKSHMGCARYWPARYNKILPADTYKDVGWSGADLWQFMGGEGNLTSFKIDDLFAHCDTSVRPYGTIPEMVKDLVW